MEEVGLKQASCKRNGLLLAEKVGQHLGDGGGRVPELQEGQCADQVVHGCVEGRVQSYDQEDEHVAADSEQVCQQQQGKEPALDVAHSGETEEHELGQARVVVWFHGGPRWGREGDKTGWRHCQTQLKTSFLFIVFFFF